MESCGPEAGSCRGGWDGQLPHARAKCYVVAWPFTWVPTLRAKEDNAGPVPAI